jgi:signal transduction histidine kinase
MSSATTFRSVRAGSTSGGRPVALGLLGLAEHVLFAGLLALGVGQSAADGTRPWVAGPVGAVVLGWYAVGIVLARRSADDAARRRAAAIWLGGLTAGWVALVVISPDFVWLVFAVFLLLLQALPLRWSIPVVLALAVGAITAVASAQQRLSAAVVIGPLTGAAVAIVITVVYRDLRDEAERRERLMDELTAAQQRLAAAERYAGTLAERERLAHEIHDTVAQGLSSVLLLLRSVLGHAQSLPDGARVQLDAAVAAARSALEDTRRVVRALAPAELAGQSLATALRRLVDDAAPVGVDLGFEVDGEPYELPTRTAVALLRTAQGALGNVIAHSLATRARVTLTYQPDEVILDVADDGRGFDPSAPAAETTAGTGIGLEAMRVRLRDVGGSLTVESSPGAGTAVRAAIPTEVPDA